MYTKKIIDVQGSSMEMLVFEPQGAGPFPGLVALQHIPVAHKGLETDPFQIDVGERLASAGYVCAMPFIFHWWPKEADITVKREGFRDDWVIADIDAAHDLLCVSPNVDTGRIGILGHCWSGRLSWLGPCRNPGFKAAATLYGGRIKTTMGKDSVPPIALTANMKCSMLGIFGNDDVNPSSEDVNDQEAALKAAGIPYEFYRYDGAGHGFQDFTNAERYRKEQSNDAWIKLLDFFDRKLK